MENQVSIIIDRVRYDAVDNNEMALVACQHCDLLDMCKAHCNFNLCEYLGVQLNCVFKKSNKKFER